MVIGPSTPSPKRAFVKSKDSSPTSRAFEPFRGLKRPVEWASSQKIEKIYVLQWISLRKEATLRFETDQNGRFREDHHQNEVEPRPKDPIRRPRPELASRPAQHLTLRFIELQPMTKQPLRPTEAVENEWILPYSKHSKPVSPAKPVDFEPF